MVVLSAALRRTLDVSSESMPWIVINVELRWKLRCPALDAPPEADAVAHWSVVVQSGGELGEFSKELVVEPQPMSMP